MKRNVRLTDRDLEILRFLWRFKIATTQVVALRFYSETNCADAYLRLWKLAKAEMVMSQFSEDKRHHAWTLTKAGFQAIRQDLPLLSQEGWASESVRHDLIVNAVQLGAANETNDTQMTVFTEQELRRIQPDAYPSWVPKSQIHRTDGYWKIEDSSGERILALEVELSQKSLVEYENVGRFYFEDTKVDQVLWIVQSPARAASIQQKISSAIGEPGNIHSFILVGDFYKLNWQAQITSGKSTGRTIASVLSTKPQTSIEHVLESPFFETRKRPRESGSRRFGRNDFFVN